MQAIIDLFTWQVFVAFGVPVTFLEIVGFITGAACVYAVAKQWTWNWPVAILNAIAFAFLFFSVGLYADAFLQLIFLVLSAYGWYKWTLGKPENAVKLPVRHATLNEKMILGLSTIVATCAVAIFLHTQTDSNVYVFDAAVLTFSILATYGQAKKIIESWWVWITVDVISIPLYFYKGLALTGILYIIFLALCIKGLYEWNRDLKAQPEDDEWETIEPVTV